MRLSPIRCSRKRISHSWLTVSKNFSDVGVQNPVHLPAVDPDDERIQRIVRAAPGPEPVREPEEIFLVDRVQHHDRRPLDNLVFQCGDRQRALPSVRLGYVDPSGRLRPIRSPMDPSMQVLEIALEVCLVVLPRHAIHARSRIPLERVERLSQASRRLMWCRSAVNCLLLPLPCCLPYALQRL